MWGGVSKQKSAYDPCPAGYKVPENSAETWKGYTKTSFTYPTTGLGATDTASGITYPLAGYRDNGSGCIKSLGAYLYMPSATMVTSNCKATSMYLVYYKTAATSKTMMNIFNAAMTTSSHIAQGYAVRCEKIQ